MNGLLAHGNNKSEKIEIAQTICHWLAACDRLKDYEPGDAKRERIALAATEIAERGIEKHGYEAWGEAANKMITQFPTHDFSTYYGQQVVWFINN